jgi:hypothetical protein
VGAVNRLQTSLQRGAANTGDRSLPIERAGAVRLRHDPLAFGTGTKTACTGFRLMLRHRSRTGSRKRWIGDKPYARLPLVMNCARDALDRSMRTCLGPNAR